MRVRVSDARCVGHGMCSLAAPEIFMLSDEDGRASVVDEAVHENFEAAVLQAERGCPEGAIIVFDRKADER